MKTGNCGKRDPLVPSALAWLLALGLGACGESDPVGKTATDPDALTVEDGRTREPAASIADETLDHATAALGDKTAPGWTGDDVALRARVRSALRAEPGLQALAIDVNAEHGAVTLYGTADTAARRAWAAHVALNVDGVKSVTNHLIILKGS